MKEELEMEAEAIEDLDVREIKKVFEKPAGRKKSSTKKNKVKLTFGSIYHRDLVMGHAVNLPEDSSIELVIPDHLQPLNRYLERFAYRVRKRGREVHDSKFSTAIRMDDADSTLLLAIREQGNDGWDHYNRDELEQLDDDLNKREEQEDELEEEEVFEEFSQTLQDSPKKTSSPNTGRSRAT